MKRSFLSASVALVILAGADLVCAGTRNGADGPLGHWPDFTPLGTITAPHPDNPDQQTPLYGDWGGIVGEEFLFLQDGLLKLLYHSYHETYLTEHPYQQEILHDWALGYDPVTRIKYPPLVRPGGPVPGPAWEHTDTPGYLQHPLTGEHLLYNTVRPGTVYLHPEWNGLPGWEGAIQVATSATPPAIGRPFTQTYENALVAELWWEQGWNQNGVIKGGLSEPTPVWVPHLGEHGMVRLFYRGLHGSTTGYWNWRISYADSEDGMTGWIKHETPTFDPADPANPAYRWTLPPPDGFGFRGAWQAHCTGDVRADGVHMVLCVSNQNYALGGRIAYYWSPDWGDTWYGHPDNPIIVPGTDPDGVPATGFQRTPTLMIDEEYHRYILAYNAGWNAESPAHRVTMIAVADRPAATPTTVDAGPDAVAAFAISAIATGPGQGGAQFRLTVPAAGYLQVAVYSIDGHRVAGLADRRVSPGASTVAWDRRTKAGAPAPSGVYLVRGMLTMTGQPAAVAVARIVVVR